MVQKYYYAPCLGFISKDFTIKNTKKTQLKGYALLTSIVNASNHKKCILLNNQKCVIQPTLIIYCVLVNAVKNFCYYPFLVKLDRYVGSCNSLKYLSNKVCVPNKTEDLNISVFTMKNCNKACIMRM